MKHILKPGGRLDPLNDIVFLKSFGEKGCEPQLISLLNAILARTGRGPLTGVSITPHRSLLPETFHAKTSVLDVLALSSSGRRFIVEIQRKNEYNMDRRSLYGWAKEYVRGIGAGQDYQELPDVVAINILDFSYLEVEGFHSSFHLYEDRQRELRLTDAAEFHFIELPKFRRLEAKDIKGNSLHRWLTYLDWKTPGKVLEEIMRKDPVIEKAKTMMDQIEADDALYHAYTRYQINLMYEKDLKRGAELKGMKKASFKIARNLKALGVPVEKIAAAANLSVEEVKKL